MVQAFHRETGAPTVLALWSRLTLTSDNGRNTESISSTEIVAMLQRAGFKDVDQVD
jgi:hypothetical protein